MATLNGLYNVNLPVDEEPLKATSTPFTPPHFYPQRKSICSVNRCLQQTNNNKIKIYNMTKSELIKEIIKLFIST